MITRREPQDSQGDNSFVFEGLGVEVTPLENPHNLSRKLRGLRSNVQVHVI